MGELMRFAMAMSDEPDAKRERAPGKWDLYCAHCGRFVQAVASPLEPQSVRCARCLRNVIR